MNALSAVIVVLSVSLNGYRVSTLTVTLLAGIGQTSFVSDVRQAPTICKSGLG